MWPRRGRRVQLAILFGPDKARRTKGQAAAARGDSLFARPWRFLKTPSPFYFSAFFLTVSIKFNGILRVFRSIIVINVLDDCCDDNKTRVGAVLV